MEASRADRILVLCIDRDDDFGQKAGVKGPVIGKSEVIEAAVKLGIKDAEDTDFNAAFEAVRYYDELRQKYDSQVALLTGHKEVGVKSDKEIAAQLDEVLRKFRANLAVLVTDGSEDEHIMPVIQSRIPILSVKRVVVRQAEKLESTYFTVKDFIKESLDNPKMSKLIFGLPALALVLVAIFGAEGWRAILGILGAYLIVKGFKLEGSFVSAGNEMKQSLTSRRFAFFMYILGIVFVSFGAYRGYISMGDWMLIGLFESIAAFLSSSAYFFWLAGSAVWVGYAFSRRTRTLRRMISIPVFGFAITIVVMNGANLILQPDIAFQNFLLSIVLGFILLFLALYAERK